MKEEEEEEEEEEDSINHDTFQVFINSKVLGDKNQLSKPRWNNTIYMAFLSLIF